MYLYLQGSPGISNVTYEPRPADDAIVTAVKKFDEPARPHEIAAETDYAKSYVSSRCRVMAEAGRLVRHEGSYVVGHDIPGLDSPVILSDNREHLLEIVRQVSPESESRASSMSIDELRKFIRDELVVDTYPLGNRKVSYAAD